MKTTANPTPKEPQYPCLKCSEEGRIVLFTSRCEGTLVHIVPGSDAERRADEIGRHNVAWAGEFFTAYRGTVTLEN